MIAQKVNELPPGDPRGAQVNGPISSLNEAWFHVLDSCVVNFPLSDVILPLVRNYFIAGATHAVLLLQKGRGDQLLRDIAGFSNETSPSVPSEPPNTRREERTADDKRKRDARIDPEALFQPIGKRVAECERQTGNVPRSSWRRRVSDEEAG
jgi:hypothetical protein